MFYTIYKITNKLDGKYYIGKHQTKNLDDGYFGSGKALKNAIKKHGIDNFTKEILFVFDIESEMNAKEKELVEINESSYNLCFGGEGGPIFLGRKHSEETKLKIKEKRQQQVFSDETKQKLSENMKKRHTNKNFGMHGKKHSSDTKEKIGKSVSESTKGKPKPWLRGRIPWNKINIADRTNR